jgi:hypothetical protein
MIKEEGVSIKGTLSSFTLRNVKTSLESDTENRTINNVDLFEIRLYQLMRFHLDHLFHIINHSANDIRLFFSSTFEGILSTNFILCGQA